MYLVAVRLQKLIWLALSCGVRTGADLFLFDLLVVGLEAVKAGNYAMEMQQLATARV